MRRGLAGMFALLMVVASCNDVQPITRDAATMPDGPASDGPSDAPDVSPMVPSTISQTGGGGHAASASVRARIAIGAPQPMGNASSASYRVRLGPITQ